MKSRNIFLAFTGVEPDQNEEVLEIQDGYSCWNLKKLTLEQFEKKIQKEIPPINEKVSHNYKTEKNTRGPFAITEDQYQECSWGLLIPDTIEGRGFNHEEALFILNLYSPKFLYPLFSVNDMGIMRHVHGKNPLIYFHSQDASIFSTSEFVAFYKLLWEQSQYAIWDFDRIQSWDKEDWRLFVGSMLYSGLKDYEGTKNQFGWQRESADMTSLLEALFTAESGQNAEVTYRLRKRMAVVLSNRFPDIEKDVTKIYDARSAFVHGSFFAQIAKDSQNASDRPPHPSFDLLYQQKEYVRWSLVSYLYLAKIVKTRQNEFDHLTVVQLLEKAIIDIKLRNKLLAEIEIIFSLIPK